MKNLKNIFVSLAIILTIALPAFAKPTRIKFKKGATSAVITGTLSSYKSQRTYVIRVREGQILAIEDIGGHAISIYIKGPDGSFEQDLAADCHGMSEMTTAKGDYILTVEECKKADPWKGTFKFRVVVK